MLMCMCMLNKRVHILFDKDLWNKLNKVAKIEKVSAGEFIRRSVKEELERKKEILSQSKSMHFKGFFKSRKQKEELKSQ